MYFLTHTISQFWFLHFSHSSVMQVNRSHHPCTFSANYTPESLDFINNYFSLIYLNLATLHHNTSPVQIQDLILYNALQALYFALPSGSLLDKYTQLIKDVSIYLPSAQDPTNFDADPDPILTGKKWIWIQIRIRIKIKWILSTGLTCESDMQIFLNLTSLKSLNYVKNSFFHFYFLSNLHSFES